MAPSKALPSNRECPCHEPDLCRGDRDAVLAEIRAAMAFHLEGLAADAEPQPPR
ncbi:hypothetical protein [Synechococcus sp. UW140]|uniref:hypothetical protein n=1 Tax=Synechococcus sp. UW140 TaxID=368503 RepID=UPI003137826B